MPVKYISYIPETTDGQAILDNFTRTRRVLRYKDNDRVIERIQRGMPLYETKQLEKIGDESENLLLRGECLSACAYLKNEGIKVDLVYIDPPFASGADYAKKVYLRKNPKFAKELADKESKINKQIEAGEVVDLSELREFEEQMYGDIWDKESYLNWMYENLHAIKSIMSEKGSIYVHLDWHIGHYVKILMDEVFGEDNFNNEIIWHYRTGNLADKMFQRKHDAIYFYSNSDSLTFNPQEVKEYYFCLYGPGFKPSFEGRKAGKDKHGDYRISQVDDVWDISGVFTLSKEHIDYATQKPEKLLERIIQASSNEGMIVADFFGGSGTTANVAHKLGRNFIISDVGINALQTTRDRLKENNASFEILDIHDGVSLFRNPVQTMEKLKSLIVGLRNEDSLDSFWEGAIQVSRVGLVPVYIPNLLDHSTKVLDIVLMNRILVEAMPELPEDTKKVIIYYIDIEDREALDKFIKEQNETQIKIELRDLKEILNEVVLNDVIEYELNKIKGGYEIELKSFISDRLQQKIDEYNQKKALQDTNKKEPLLKSQKSKYKPIDISDNGLELIEMVSLDCTNKKGVWKSDTEIKIDKKSFVIRDGKKSQDSWDGKITSKKKPKRMKVRNIAGDESIIEL